MHEYTVFLIEDEFKFHYFYKSDLLHRFFNEYLNVSNEELYDRQFNYITRDLPHNQIQNCINSYHGNQVEVSIDRDKITLTKNSSRVSLILEKKSFIIQAKTMEDADELIFQPLKLFDSNFFVIETGTNNAGWISPVKKEILL